MVMVGRWLAVGRRANDTWAVLGSASPYTGSSWREVEILTADNDVCERSMFDA